jgi:hypothetical protein
VAHDPQLREIRVAKNVMFLAMLNQPSLFFEAGNDLASFGLEQ